MNKNNFNDIVENISNCEKINLPKGTYVRHG